MFRMKTLVLLLIFSSPFADAKCINSVAELRINNVKITWDEITSTDTPLNIYLEDKSGLHLTVSKNGQKLALGDVTVCLEGGRPKITFTNIKALEDAPMFIKAGLPRSTTAYINNNHITMGNSLWSGIFVGR
jgi:hypothetical protein